jgi:hypothetical protein
VSNVDIFRPRSSVFAAFVAYSVIAIMVIQTFFISDAYGCISATIWGTFAATLTYLILHRPKVELFDEGIRITNPFDQITVGWQSVDSIDAKYTMSIQVDHKVIYAWAAPAPGRYHSRRIHPSEIKGMDIGIGGFIRPGDSPRTHSGAAAYLAIMRLKGFRDAGSMNGCGSSVIKNKNGLLVLIISCVLGIIFNIYHF